MNQHFVANFKIIYHSHVVLRTDRHLNRGRESGLMTSRLKLRHAPTQMSIISKKKSVFIQQHNLYIIIEPQLIYVYLIHITNKLILK